MFISIDERAASWFTREFEFHKPFSIRMFPQYAGFGMKHRGFSLAFSAETPANVGYTIDVNGITFFVEVNDVWFFGDTETCLTIDNDSEELLVQYNELASSAVS
ncbi:Uncharacterized protein YneR [Bacillus sp. OV166]|uniref:HesB/YadR/YfhF family protein n=1 Tax=unclassified Bacillus (in: firmicutes) TaxID=185979 RepID=UPI000A2AA445|nr:MULTISPECIES: hypothetical protein [unclassified Bacillus (in: firmicutes)]PGY11209.1 hypothetical protein COE25_11875 [Bacillus sp. AFS031507]SMQ66292.1 Uncharacterized protein YneR [Bacillus sp. OV166]